MNTKLTLTIDDSVIKQAKAYAEKQGRSLSAVVENYLKAVTKREEVVSREEELSPIVKRLTGSINLPNDFDYKTALSDSINEKYSQ
ncbi:DUF6364 family protein [Pedobacter sp. CFBP9032]|uniref:DUF6364 family protein n=1 Tax=Pedobacter sp. CFBP9032 TaxID=3096539 RepID=UPI002A6B1317|nr:DUF6364 family protein [Pedobacter sp. CFBP9032]MDY0906970.1 DUF6364 family protein [Pedobacter sp. CFBP9032]